MNDSDLEDQLRTLSPAAPPADLEARIGHALSAAPAGTRTAGVLPRPARTGSVLRWLRDLGWAGAGAAAMLAGVLWFSPRETPVVPVISEAAVVEEQAFEPTGTSRELLAVEDANELIETEDGPVREVRYTYLERLAWAHPATGAQLEIEVPREDILLLPVSLQ